MKKKVKVSIIIPVYNTGKYLDNCLNSLVNQTLKELEIIVVDDGSKEDIKSIVEKYNNIVYIKNKHMGIGYTRNTGIKKARGEYIGFVDGDDYVDVKMYEEYYNYATNNDLDVVVGNLIKTNDKEQRILNVPYFDISNIKKNPRIIMKIDYGPCNKIFKKDLIIKNKILFDEKLKYEDMPFVARTIYESNMIGHINKAYYYYVVRNESETMHFDERNFDVFKVFDIFSNIFKKKYFEETEFVIVSKLLDYNIQQRVNKDKVMRNRFIDETFNYINNHFSNYRQNKYLSKEKFLKKIIKDNKFITKIYCNLYHII